MDPNLSLQLADTFPQLNRDADPVVASLLTDAVVVRKSAQSSVFLAGDACSHFLLVIDGCVRVQLTSSGGRQVTLYRIEPGNSCVLTTSCLLGGDRYPAEAIAETDVKAVAIGRGAFQRALGESERVRQFVFEGFAARLATLIARIDAISFMSVDVRLASALLVLARRREERITHQALAVELGTAREVVSRHLKQFERSGWILQRRGRIGVLDPGALQALVDEGQRG